MDCFSGARVLRGSSPSVFLRRYIYVLTVPMCLCLNSLRGSSKFAFICCHKILVNSRFIGDIVVFF